MAAVRRDAGRELGRARARAAAYALERGQGGRAMELLEAARAVTGDPGVEAEVRGLVPAATRAAADEADRLADARQYPQAIALLERAARLDPRWTGRLEAIRAEQEAWLDAEAERLTLEGDGFLRGGRYGEARARYLQAASFRPSGRAATLAAYAGLLLDGEEAVRRRDFAAAERRYEEAARSQADDGRAREALELVRVRPWAVSLRAVRVRPGGPRGPLVVVVRLPDGRAVQTEPRDGGRARLDATFVVAANAYDDRVVSARVLRLTGRDEAPFDLGTVSFRLADAIRRGPLSLEDGAVDGLVVDAAPSALPAGALRGLSPVPDAPPPPPPPRPQPPPPPRPRK
jgi:tetratricopeptide (TPR) repeat protein